MPADKRTEKSPLQSARNLRSKTECCRICKNSIDPTNSTVEPSVKCSKCDDNFHCSCAGVSNNFFVFYILHKQTKWLCYSFHCDTMDSTEATSTSIKNIEEVASKMNADVQNLATEIFKLKNSDSSWKQEMELKIESEIDRKIDLKLPTFALKNTPRDKTSNSHEASQTHNSYRRNLVIAGVPETDNENMCRL